MATKPPNGIYTFSGRPGSSYKYENNQWFVSNSGTKNQYVPMQDPTGNRAKTLEAGLKSGKTQFTQILPTKSSYNQLTVSTPADNTRVANADFAAAAMANRGNVARAVAAEKKAQYEFEKDKWEDYNKMSPTEKVVDRVDAFLTDPLGMVSRAVSGEQAYIPGMGQGLVDYENPNRNRYLQAVGYTPGKFEPSDIQNMANPGYWGASITNNLNKGNYGTAAAETVLSLFPFLPKGSGRLVKQGAGMLADDITKAGKYLTTQTPLRNAWRLNPKAYQYNLPENTMWRGLGQEGMQDAIESGVFRAKATRPPGVPDKSGIRLKGKGFGNDIYFSPEFDVVDSNRYGKGIIAEVPKSSAEWKILKSPNHASGWSQFTDRPIPIDQGRILKKDWLRGYKEVPIELPELPNLSGSKQLIDLSKVDFSKVEKPSEWLSRYQLANQLRNEGLIPTNVASTAFGRSKDVTGLVTKEALERANTVYRATTPNISKVSAKDIMAMLDKGVDLSDEIAVAEYMNTHVPYESYGYRANPISPGYGQDLLYTGNYENLEEAAKGLSHYGTHISELRPNLDFTTGTPQEWFQKYYQERPFIFTGKGGKNAGLGSRELGWKEGAIATFPGDKKYYPFVGNKGSQLLNAVSTTPISKINYTEVIPPVSTAKPSSMFKSGLGNVGMDMSMYTIKNPDYYTQLLNTYDKKALSATNRKFYKDLIATVKKQDGLVTERQLNELKRLATGNFDFGSKGYNKGYAEGGSLAKNIPTYYDYSGTPIYRDTTALPFPDGGYLSLQNAMLGPLPEREKPNSVLAYNKFVEATKTPNQSAYIKPSYSPESNHYKYGFFGTNSGNIYGGAGYGLPKYGLEANVFGSIPAQSDPYYKGFYSAQLAKQFGNNRVGLGVSSPVVGYTDDSGFHMNRLELSPQLSFRKNFAEGGPLETDPKPKPKSVTVTDSRDKRIDEYHKDNTTVYIPFKRKKSTEELPSQFTIPLEALQDSFEPPAIVGEENKSEFKIPDTFFEPSPIANEVSTIVPEFVTTRRYDSNLNKWIENPMTLKDSPEAQYDKQRWEWAKKNIENPANISYKFADGGPLNDKTDHGKILNSIYASALGDYYASGGMLKRADGSYSRRGLWDNIRANRGSGKAPTKEMLAQEKKINAKANGGFVAGRQMYQPLDIRESYGGFLYGNGGQFPTTFSLPEDSFKQGGNNLHDSVYASSMAQYPAVYAIGGNINVVAGGEKHRVYIKESPTGMGEGVKGHVMVNHPTMDKGQWDTIDLTKKAGAKTVKQGIAATKKWHRENPQTYSMGGSILSMSNTPQLEGEGKDLSVPENAYIYSAGGSIKKFKKR